MLFIARSNKDVSCMQTEVWPQALRTIDSGPLTGTSYFSATGEEPKAISRDLWPTNFLQGELLDTDAKDEAALLTLQSKFGQIASPVFSTMTGKVSFQFPASSALSNNRKSVFRKECEGATLTLNVNNYLREKGDASLFDAVSVAEASATLETLQALIRATTRAWREQTDLLDERLSHTFVALANCLKHQYFKPYACCEDESEANIEVVSVPFVASAVFAHMEELCNAKAYFICDECGRWKSYRRKVPKPGEHHFCSEKCRNAFTSRQQYGRKKKDRAAQHKEEKHNGEE